MRKHALLALLLVASACGRPDHKPDPTRPPVPVHPDNPQPPTPSPAPGPTPAPIPPAPGPAPGPTPAPIPPAPGPTPAPIPPAPGPTPAPQPPANGFVRAVGTHLELDGQKFVFNGSNFYRLSLLDQKQSDQQVYDIAKAYADKNVRVLRVWGFHVGNSGREIISGFKNGLPVYNEAGLKRLDLAVDAANKNGLKLIIPLVNFNPEYGSMKDFVQGVTGNWDMHQFYSDKRVRKAFKSYVQTILNRTNTLTNRAYKDEPAIMAIELSNEAHTEDGYDRNRGLAPGETVYRWVKEMSAFVKEVDKNHLVTIGDEGYKAHPSSAAEASKHQWLSDGTKGVDFERNISLPTVDLATAHFYPTNWGIPKSDLDWLKTYVVADRARIAAAAGKPIILEETGVSLYGGQNLGWAQNPEFFFKEFYSAAWQAGYSGVMAWELVPPGTEDGDYIFDFNSAAGRQVLSGW